MRYQLWNKIDTIYTPAGIEFSATQWVEKYPWIKIPGAKMIITAGVINGGAAMEFNAAIDHYRRLGAVITDDMTDEEVLTAIEYFEDHPPVPEPSAEERIAAAMEFQNAMSL